MIRKFIFIFLVASISYYAGYKRFTTKDFLTFFDSKNIGQNSNKINDVVKDIGKTIKNLE
tara:strand:+ start:1249 stop:1428 length:180 start_codon:yes stop_codon:yes gene_type:complete